MTDALNKFGEILVNNLTNAAWTDLVIYGIGFIGFCMLGSLLTRKDRKANPGAHPYDGFNAAQNNTAGSVVINGQSHHVTRVGNTTYID